MICSNVSMVHKDQQYSDIVLSPIFVQPLICGRSVKYLSLTSPCICPLPAFVFVPHGISISLLSVFVTCSLFNG